MILIMKILLHNVYKIIILRYPTYVYQFFNFPYNYKIECWPVFKQDPKKTLFFLTYRGRGGEQSSGSGRNYWILIVTTVMVVVVVVVVVLVSSHCYSC